MGQQRVPRNLGRRKIKPREARHSDPGGDRTSQEDVAGPAQASALQGQSPWLWAEGQAGSYLSWASRPLGCKPSAHGAVGNKRSRGPPRSGRPALSTGVSGHRRQCKVRWFVRAAGAWWENAAWADGLRVVSASVRPRAGPRGKPTKATVTRRPVVSLDRTPECRSRPSWPPPAEVSCHLQP